MKLLLDQNLSWRLVQQLQTVFPGTVHLRSVLDTSSDDREIWNYARENGFTIVSKDDDFEQRSILLGHPPKVVWIRLGNCKSEQIASLLQASLHALLAFDRDDEKSILPLP